MHFVREREKWLHDDYMMQMLSMLHALVSHCLLAFFVQRSYCAETTFEAVLQLDMSCMDVELSQEAIK